MEGYIKIHRQIVEWEWYTDGNTFRLFMHILLKANHKEKKWRGVTIKRGEFVTSLQKLAEETGLSVRNIRTSLKRLKATGEVTSKGQASFTIVKVQNYDRWQASDTQSDTQVTRKGHASDTQVTTTKNEKNNKNEKNIISKDITTKVEEPTFGNKEINDMLGFLGRSVGIDEFKESQKWQRIYGKHFLNYISKIGKESFIDRLKGVLSDDFKANNSNSIKYLYNEIKAYRYNPIENTQPKITVY